LRNEEGRAMARKVRIEYAGAVCLLMARGNPGQSIFANDLDRKSWLNTLGQAFEKTGWRIHAWVLTRPCLFIRSGRNGCRVLAK